MSRCVPTYLINRELVHTVRIHIPSLLRENVLVNEPTIRDIQ
jgi:hypothetical protein